MKGRSSNVSNCNALHAAETGSTLDQVGHQQSSSMQCLFLRRPANRKHWLNTEPSGPPTKYVAAMPLPAVPCTNRRHRMVQRWAGAMQSWLSVDSASLAATLQSDM